jgi:hypothetical protein
LTPFGLPFEVHIIHQGGRHGLQFGETSKSAPEFLNI